MAIGDPRSTHGSPSNPRTQVSALDRWRIAELAIGGPTRNPRRGESILSKYSTDAGVRLSGIRHTTSGSSSDRQLRSGLSRCSSPDCSVIMSARDGCSGGKTASVDALERQIERVSGRVSCTEALARLLVQVAEMEADYAARCRDMSSAMLDLTNEHRLMRSATQSMVAMQAWQADLHSRAAARCMEEAQALLSTRTTAMATIRSATTQLKAMRKEQLADTKAMDKALAQCERASDQAIVAHWALVDYTNSSTADAPVDEQIVRAAAARKKELIAADRRYCDTVRQARAGAIVRPLSFPAAVRIATDDNACSYSAAIVNVACC